jgi:hypothetical protein
LQLSGGNFGDSLQIEVAAKISANFLAGGQFFQERGKQILNYLDAGIPIFFYTILTFQGISLLGLALSIFIVGMVVST